MALVNSGMVRGATASFALHAGALGLAVMSAPPPEPPPELAIEVIWQPPPQSVEPPKEPPQAAAPPPPPTPTPSPSRAESQPQAEPAEPAAAAPPKQILPPPPATKPRRPPPREATPPAATQVVAPPVASPLLASPAETAAPPAALQDDYVRTLLHWLEPHRRYPRTARLRGLEGVVQIAMTIDRAGRVLEAVVARSSGARLLDRAAIEMVERAAPAPPPPAHWPAAQTVFIVPIRFALAASTR